ncbi:CoA transferase [Sinorhizobium psoraleae]|uniref:CoA transferase n=1 Tax=Sinorhizobium psoraleae TaxID=520838 RepID=UPI0035E3D752
MIVAVGNDRQFVKFCDVLSRPELATDARYLTNAGRVQHRDTLTPELAAETEKVYAGCASGEARSRGRAGRPDQHGRRRLADPQILHRQMRVIDAAYRRGGRYFAGRQDAAWFSGASLRACSAARPGLGSTRRKCCPRSAWPSRKQKAETG